MECQRVSEGVQRKRTHFLHNYKVLTHVHIRICPTALNYRLKKRPSKAKRVKSVVMNSVSMRLIRSGVLTSGQ